MTAENDIEQPKKHHLSGIISLAIAISYGLITIGSLFYGSDIATSSTDTKTEDIFSIISYILIFGYVAHFAGMIFGYLGIRQKDHKKSIAYTGLILNLLLACLISLFILLTMMIGQSPA